jgi:uncharacterized protein (DUF433 family)
MGLTSGWSASNAAWSWRNLARFGLALAFVPKAPDAVTNSWSACPAVERDPNKVSGAWVFRGTRVPVSAPFENLEDGAQVSDFVAWFPGVAAEQVRAVLEHVAHTLETA